jgi:hypothetical protein
MNKTDYKVTNIGIDADIVGYTPCTANRPYGYPEPIFSNKTRFLIIETRDENLNSPRFIVSKIMDDGSDEFDNHYKEFTNKSVSERIILKDAYNKKLARINTKLIRMRDYDPNG